MAEHTPPEVAALLAELATLKARLAAVDILKTCGLDHGGHLGYNAVSLMCVDRDHSARVFNALAELKGTALRAEVSTPEAKPEAQDNPQGICRVCSSNAKERETWGPGCQSYEHVELEFPCPITRPQG